MARNGRIVLPHAWEPRPWQREVLEAYKQGCKRFLLVVHRRAGKDQVMMNLAAIASQNRVGQYHHVFYSEDGFKEHIWRGASKNGVRFIDQAFPAGMRKNTLNNDLTIELANGSYWIGGGANNLRALRGGNAIGVTFSEYAFMDPMIWSSIYAPILRENNGWAGFISTPWGKNHFYELYKTALKNPSTWHVQYLPVTATLDNEGSRLISDEDVIALAEEDGLEEADIAREYYCDWSANYTGAYYRTEMQRMRGEGRIKQIDYDPKIPVIGAWDIGFADELVCLMFQKRGNAHYCIGSRAWVATKYEDALNDLTTTFPWPIEKHILPHDAGRGSVQTGLTDAQAFRAMGCRVEQLKVLPHATGVQAVRNMLPTMWVDHVKRPWTERGVENNAKLIEALDGYRTTKNKHGAYARTALHSWESHWADALRTYATSHTARAGAEVRWKTKPDYTLQDMGVI